MKEAPAVGVQVWAFTPDELKRPTRCNRDDMLLHLWDDGEDRHGHRGIYVFRDGRASNQYDDGAHGTSRRDRARACRDFRANPPWQEDDADQNRLPDGPVSAGCFRKVRATRDGQFIGFVAQKR